MREIYTRSRVGVRLNSWLPYSSTPTPTLGCLIVRLRLGNRIILLTFDCYSNSGAMFLANLFMSNFNIESRNVIIFSDIELHINKLINNAMNRHMYICIYIVYNKILVLKSSILKEILESWVTENKTMKCMLYSFHVSFHFYSCEAIL